MKSTFLRFAAAAALVIQLVGCGGGGGGGSDSTTTTPQASAISLGTSAIQVKSDNSDEATITATVVDTNNAALSGVTVSFKADFGFITSSSVVTDSTGKATVKLSSGTADASNRTATVTATTSNGKTATIPVLVSGSTLTLSASATTGVANVDTITLTATAKNAGSVGVNAQKIKLSIDSASQGAGTLSATTLTTGTAGATPSATLKLTAGGKIVVKAEWLDGSDNASVTATKDITVSGGGSSVIFQVASPASDPAAVRTLSTTAVSFDVPATIDGNTIATVRLSANAGTWSNGSTTIDKTPSGSAVSDSFTAPATAGNVTIQAEARNASGTVISTLLRTFAVSAAVPAKVSLQTSLATIAPSTGSSISTSDLIATVRDANNNAVSDAAVLFELLGTTGTGESISPAVAYSKSDGTATATFSAGSLPTNGPINVRASVITSGSNCTTAPALCDTKTLTVASTAVSVTVAFASEISSVNNNTMYQWNGSVLVTNAQGGPAKSTRVTLGVFPIQYYKGDMVFVSGTGCATSYTTGALPNEDTLVAATARNGILDAGEDASGDGRINPVQTNGGAISPQVVTTDDNGVAAFTLTYPKESAWFVRDEITARVTVSGTESSAKTERLLNLTKADSTVSECTIAGSRNP